MYYNYHSQWPTDYSARLKELVGTHVYLNDTSYGDTLHTANNGLDNWYEIGYHIFHLSEVSHIVSNLIDDKITIVLRSA
jgi:hypothetical protein